MKYRIFFLFGLIISASVVTIFAQGIAFTYQGRLTDSGATPAGIYDLRFSIYNAPAAGGAGAVVTNTAVTVSNGLFTVALDFGAGIFTGADRWLEIGVRTNGSGAFTTLSPRQKLTATPYAITAGTVTGVVPSAGVAGTYANAVTFSNSANNFSGNYSGNGGGLTNVSARTLEGQSAASFWQTSGNAGTTPGVNFLGTTDDQPLEFKVNGQRVLRIEQNGTNAPNFIAGSSTNQVDVGVIGATIGGGGSMNDPGGANRISGSFSVIGGGIGNTIQPAFGATISGGTRNVVGITAYRSTISGGAFNTIEDQAAESTIAGGQSNTIQTDATDSTIGGGLFNRIESGAFPSYTASATIGGGVNNIVQRRSSESTISGGGQNLIQGDAFASTIGGGIDNTIQTNAQTSTISGGRDNTIGTNARNAAIPGGSRNTAIGQGSFAAGNGAQALNDGAFVWSDFDRSFRTFASIVTNEFAIRATGGARFVSAIDASGTPTAGVSLPAGGGSWLTFSDRNAKENFVPVNKREILERVTTLPLSTWNYRSQEKSIRHLGPMAQDFAAAFHIGEDERHIATVDEEGVALAAIQGLNEKLELQIKTQDLEIQALKDSVRELKQLVVGRVPRAKETTE